MLDRIIILTNNDNRIVPKILDSTAINNPIPIWIYMDLCDVMVSIDARSPITGWFYSGQYS